MTKTRRQFTAKFKFEVALTAMKESETISEIASRYEVHPTQVKQWKSELRKVGLEIFSQTKTKKQEEQEGHEEKLYAEIGRLKMEVDWLKKK